MIGSVTRFRSVATALLLPPVLALGACSGDDPEPRLAAPSSSSASPSGTSAPLNPVEAFSAWVDARNRALQSGDTAAVEALSAPSCRTCRNAIAPIKQVFQNGGRFNTEGWTVVASRLKARSADDA